VIRRLIGLGTLGLVAAAIVDRLLARRAEGRLPSPIHSMIVVDAPIDRVWAELSDIEGQPRWMREMRSVRLTTPPPVGVGTMGEAEVRVLGITVNDPVTVTEFVPPHRFVIRHEGVFEGGGVIRLEPGADGTTTSVRWDESLVPPFFPYLGAAIQRPILGPIFQADLEHLRALVEA
jgi:uncharacterized protein YndB with AHSA1/START domain